VSHGVLPRLLGPAVRAALALAEQYPFVYAAVGVHPEELKGWSGDLDAIRALAVHPRCVAIGEIGLDYYWDDSHKAEQKALFRAQLELALALDKPVIVHDREAHGDCLSLVCEYPGLRCVFHCYSGSAEMAKELIKRGWYLGFDGPVTYKNARKALEVLSVTPLDRILVENPMKGEYYIQTPINSKIADGSATYEVLTSSDKWFGVTYKEDKPEVVKKFAALKADGTYPEYLWK
jgi:TatD DNase family protein